RKTRRGTNTTGDHNQSRLQRGCLDEHGTFIGHRISSGPTLPDRGGLLPGHCPIFFKDQPIDSLVRKRLGGRIVVMAVADNQTAVRALRNDEMDAMPKILT